MLTLNNMLPTPLYTQLYNMLVEQIKSGQLEAGDKIPSERELCEEYGLSRITVRQAIKAGINEGFLYSIPGKGTFVKKPEINQEMIKLVGFEETLLARGLKPSMKILSVEKVPGDIGINSLLGLNLEEEIMKVQVIGLAEGLPMALFKYSLPALLGSRAFEELKKYEEKGEWFSFTEYYRSLGFQLNIVKQTFEAQVADEDVSRVLDISRTSPVFLVTSLMYTVDNKPVEFRTTYYRGDRYKFNVTRKIK